MNPMLFIRLPPIGTAVGPRDDGSLCSRAQLSLSEGVRILNTVARTAATPEG